MIDSFLRDPWSYYLWIMPVVFLYNLLATRERYIVMIIEAYRIRASALQEASAKFKGYRLASCAVMAALWPLMLVMVIFNHLYGLVYCEDRSLPRD